MQKTIEAFRALIALVAMLASGVALAAPPPPINLTVLFTGDNTGEIEPCG